MLVVEKLLLIPFMQWFRERLKSFSTLVHVTQPEGCIRSHCGGMTVQETQHLLYTI